MKWKIYLVISEVYAILFSFLFSSTILSCFTSIGFDADIAKALIGFIMTSVLIHLAKLASSIHSETVDDKNKCLGKKFEAFEGSVDDIKEAYIKIHTGISRIEEDNSNIHLTLKELQCETKRTADTLKEMSDRRDIKAKRYREYEEDWNGMKGNIEELNNEDVYAFARLMKETIQKLSNQFQSSDLKLPKDVLQNILREKFNVTIESMYAAASYKIPKKYLDFYQKRNSKNEIFLFEEIDNLLQDRVNRRDEGLHVGLKLYFRKALNTIYNSWVEFIIINKDELATTEIGRRYLELHEMSQFTTENNKC